MVAGEGHLPSDRCSLHHRACLLLSLWFPPQVGFGQRPRAPSHPSRATGLADETTSVLASLSRRPNLSRLGHNKYVGSLGHTRETRASWGRSWVHARALPEGCSDEVLGLALVLSRDFWSLLLSQPLKGVGEAGNSQEPTSGSMCITGGFYFPGGCGESGAWS